MFPILGGRNIDHLKSNIEALSLELSEAEIEEIESATDFDVGFPMNFLYMGQKYNTSLTSKDVTLVKSNALLDGAEKQKPIPAHPKEV